MGLSKGLLKGENKMFFVSSLPSDSWDLNIKARFSASLVPYEVTLRTEAKHGGGALAR